MQGRVEGGPNPSGQAPPRPWHGWCSARFETGTLNEVPDRNGAVADVVDQILDRVILVLWSV